MGGNLEARQSLRLVRLKQKLVGEVLPITLVIVRLLMELLIDVIEFVGLRCLHRGESMQLRTFSTAVMQVTRITWADLHAAINFIFTGEARHQYALILNAMTQ